MAEDDGPRDMARYMKLFFFRDLPGFVLCLFHIKLALQPLRSSKNVLGRDKSELNDVGRTLLRLQKTCTGPHLKNNRHFTRMRFFSCPNDFLKGSLQTVIHYGWIPFIIYVGYTRSNPQPSLIK